MAGRARNVIVALAAAGVSVMVVLGFLADNPERAALKRRERQLDAELVQKRAIARDLERYREEAARLRDRVEEARLLLGPDLAKLGEKLSAVGAHLEAGSPQAHGFYRALPFTVRVPRAALEPAVRELLRAGLLLRAGPIVIGAGECTLAVRAFEFVEREPKPPEAVPERTWYSSINDDTRARIEDKEREVARLDAEIGPVARLTKHKRDLKERLEVISAILKESPPVLEVVGPLFIGPSALLAVGRLDRDGTARGEPIADMSMEVAATRFTHPWKLERWSSGEDGVELALAYVDH